MERLSITVVCVLGLVSGHLLKASLECALAQMDVRNVSIDVKELETLGSHAAGIVICTETLKSKISRLKDVKRLYTVKNVFDLDELRLQLSRALRDAQAEMCWHV